MTHKAIAGKISRSRRHNYHVWKTVGDNRVRSPHAHRKDKIYHRDHPPEGGQPGK